MISRNPCDLQYIMEKSLDLKTQNSELEAPHCLKCGAYHFQNECTVYVESFYWPYEAGEVFLIGSWSQWKKKETMMKMEDYYVCQVSLPLGTYEYKFLVDGKWTHDKNEPVILNSYKTYNHVRKIIPKNAYLDQYELSDEDQSLVDVPFESTLMHQGLKLIGSWDNWTIERPLRLQASVLKNSNVYRIILKLQKGNKYQFKFKTDKGQYFTDEFYPAIQNQKGSINNYIITSSFTEAKTPIVVRNSLKKSNSIREIEWVWEKQDFQDLNSYNLYGHSLICIGDILYIFGGIFRNEFRNYMIKIPLCDLSEYEQEKITIPPRAYHTAVADGTKIIIFGGLNTTVLNDCIIYNTATKEWSDSLEMSGSYPSSRQKSTGVLYKDSIILYGGYFCCPKTETEIIYNDIHIFNTQLMLWIKPQIQQKNAPKRFAHSATIIGDEMLIFGGISTTTDKTDSNELWKLKIEKDDLKWSFVETTGVPPEPRHGHTANIVMNYLLVFGGADAQQVFNNVYLLQLDSMEWISPIISGQIPRSVVYHAAISVSNELIVIGGKTSGQKYKPSVLILKPKCQRRKSFSIFSPSFQDQENDYIFY